MYRQQTSFLYSIQSIRAGNIIRGQQKMNYKNLHIHAVFSVFLLQVLKQSLSLCFVLWLSEASATLLSGFTVVTQVCSPLFQSGNPSSLPPSILLPQQHSGPDTKTGFLRCAILAALLLLVNLRLVGAAGVQLSGEMILF